MRTNGQQPLRTFLRVARKQRDADTRALRQAIEAVELTNSTVALAEILRQIALEHRMESIKTREALERILARLEETK